GELAGLLPDAHQSDEYLAEGLRLLRERLRERLAALDGVGDCGNHRAQPVIFGAVAQVAECVEDWNARGNQLLEVEAEVDPVLAAHARVRRTRAPPTRRSADDEVEPHAPHPLLQVVQVCRIRAPEDAASGGVDRLVRVQHAYPMRSVRSTTRISSSMVVTPRR